MYLINPILTDNRLDNEGYNELILDIDRTILYLSEMQYTNQVYGFQNYVDMTQYDVLCIYREILVDKLMGCNCLDDEYILYIINKIKKITC